MLSILTGQQPLPLDPLTAEENEIASRVARSDSRVKKELGSGRNQLVQVQFLELKAGGDLKTNKEQGPSNPGRYAAVLFYRYDTDEGVHVVVNLGGRSVGEITRLNGRAVPLALEEVSGAFALALLNKQVRTFLGPKADEYAVAGMLKGDSPHNRVEGLRVIATSPEDPCYRHRCIELYVRKPEGYMRTPSITVDLSARKVKIRNR